MWVLHAGARGCKEGAGLLPLKWESKLGGGQALAQCDAPRSCTGPPSPRSPSRYAGDGSDGSAGLSPEMNRPARKSDEPTKRRGMQASDSQ